MIRSCADPLLPRRRPDHPGHLPRRSVLTGALALALTVLSAASGQSPAGLPQIRLDSVFPPGGRVGTTVEIAVSGVDFDDAKALHFDHPGLSATLTAPGKFKVAIAADATPGVWDARVSGKHGISNPRAFAVSSGGDELLQKTPNHTPEEAQRVPFGCVVNGQFRGALDDYYRVPVKAGQRVLVEVLAERIDSPHDATLSVLAPDGREVGGNTDHFGRDPLVDFTAREDGDYLVRVWDFLYQGGSNYRLLIGNRPVLDAVDPPLVAPGAATDATLIGRNLPGGKPLAALDRDGKQRAAVSARLTAPAEPRWFVPPRSFPLDDRFFQHQLVTPLGSSHPLTLRLHEGPIAARRPGNDSSEQAQELRPGEAVSAVLDRYNAAHWYRLRLRAKEPCWIEVANTRLGGRGDLYLQAFDPKGKLIAEFDDTGSNYGGACRCTQRDPQGSFTADGVGEYRLVVRNRARDGSPLHRYVLTAGPARPDFAVYACWNLSENLRSPRPLLAGARQYLDIVVVRRDQLGEPVECTVEGLPPSVECSSLQLPYDRERGVLVFSAAEHAGAWDGPVRIRCRARLGGRVIERFAWGSVMLNDTADPQLQLPSRLARQVWLGVRPGPAPFTLTARAAADVVRGQKLPVEVTARRAPGFTGKITLTALQLPNGWKLPPAEIAAGAAAANFEIEIAANASAAPHDLVLRGEGQAVVRDKKESLVGLPANSVRILVKEK